MITEEVRDSIIEVLGPHYITTILEYAEEKGFTRKNGEPYHRDSFSKVLHGRHQPKIEDFIIDCAKHHKRQNEIREKKMREFAESVQKTA